MTWRTSAINDELLIWKQLNDIFKVLKEKNTDQELYIQQN